ncbi:kiwellin-1-like [Rhodamnia argentea]|uniref:Kiwellin-1-like n=1 Tax=Rhodamnia argentea TaxID=178133 RepID=A0A8B8N962_9MYRT|nr:kiwellin-1-like [Rhodamnia argentea]
MKLLHPALSHVLISVLAIVVASAAAAEAQACRHSGKLRGTRGKRDTAHGSDCCKSGEFYPTYRCSPPMTGRTKATLTLNSFEKGGDGDAPSECNNQFHCDSTPVVALSTGWYHDGKRCHKEITIHVNRRSVKAKVVDERDSTTGCDKDHDFQPPCPNNIVDASKVVWKALGVPESDWGEMEIFWSED